jgi:hypothetical protein
MSVLKWLAVLPVFCLAGLLVPAPSEAQAQVPMAFTTVQPAVVPVVTYMPERRGLFGLQTVYRPVVTFAAPAPVVVASPVVQTFQPAPVLAPVTVHRMPVPVTAFQSPVVVAPTPAPVTTFRAPVVLSPAPAPVTVFSPPVQVVTPFAPVIVQ